MFIISEKKSLSIFIFTQKLKWTLIIREIIPLPQPRDLERRPGTVTCKLVTPVLSKVETGRLLAAGVALNSGRDPVSSSEIRSQASKMCEMHRCFIFICESRNI